MDSRKILMIGGLDPTGGAGLVADTETAAAFGCRALVLATALTAQNSSGVRRIDPVDPAALRAQAETLLDEFTPDAVKIGMLATRATAALVAELLDQVATPRVVLDPVLSSGAGNGLAETGLADSICRELVPKCALITPNTAEFAALSDARVALSCPVLITGTDAAASGEVVHELRSPGLPAQRWRWRRLPHRYHGSGCTLASAIACRLALGDALPVAIAAAMAYTWETLAQAIDPGAAQWLPLRGPAEKFTKRGQRGAIC